MSKKQLIVFIILVLFHELIQIIIYFKYSFLQAGWHNLIACRIITILLITVPFLIFFSIKQKKQYFIKLLIGFLYFLFFISLVFAIFMPFIVSQETVDLFVVKKANVLNPAIEMPYIFFISIVFILIPQIIHIQKKKLINMTIPVLLWLILRFIIHSETSFF